MTDPIIKKGQFGSKIDNLDDLPECSNLDKRSQTDDIPSSEWSSAIGTKRLVVKEYTSSDSNSQLAQLAMALPKKPDESQDAYEQRRMGYYLMLKDNPPPSEYEMWDTYNQPADPKGFTPVTDTAQINKALLRKNDSPTNPFRNYEGLCRTNSEVFVYMNHVPARQQSIFNNKCTPEKMYDKMKTPVKLTNEEIFGMAGVEALRLTSDIYCCASGACDTFDTSPEAASEFRFTGEFLALQRLIGTLDIDPDLVWPKSWLNAAWQLLGGSNFAYNAVPGLTDNQRSHIVQELNIAGARKIIYDGTATERQEADSNQNKFLMLVFALGTLASVYYARSANRMQKKGLLQSEESNAMTRAALKGQEEKEKAATIENFATDLVETAREIIGEDLTIPIKNQVELAEELKGKRLKDPNYIAAEEELAAERYVVEGSKPSELDKAATELLHKISKGPNPKALVNRTLNAPRDVAERAAFLIAIKDPRVPKKLCGQHLWWETHPEYTIIGRESKVDGISQTLTRKTNPTAFVEGDTGTGKHVVAESLALRIARDDPSLPKPLIGKALWEMDTGAVIAGSKYRGDVGERFKLFEVASKNGDITYIPETGKVLKLGSAGDSDDESLKLWILKQTEKPHARFLFDGKPGDYKRMIAQGKQMADKGGLSDMERRVENYTLEHLTPNVIFSSISGQRRAELQLEKNCIIPDATVEAATRLGIVYRKSPTFAPFSAAISTLEEAIGKARIGIPDDVQVTVTPEHVVKYLEGKYGVAIDPNSHPDLLKPGKYTEGYKATDLPSEIKLAESGGQKSGNPIEDLIEKLNANPLLESLKGPVRETSIQKMGDVIYQMWQDLPDITRSEYELSAILDGRRDFVEVPDIFIEEYVSTRLVTSGRTARPETSKLGMDDPNIIKLNCGIPIPGLDEMSLPMSIPEWKDLAVKVGEFAKPAAQGGAVFLTAEYASEAIMAAATGDWSKMNNLSAVDVLKNYGALTLGSGIGTAANESIFNAYPALARVPSLKGVSGHYLPMLAAILLMQKVNGEEITTEGVAMTVGNLAAAQAVVLPLRRGLQAMAKAGKIAKGTSVIGAVAVTVLEFVILKMLGEFETAIIMEAPLNQAKTQIASLIMEHNDMMAKMQRGEFVSATAFAKNQTAMLAWQARVADMTEQDAQWPIREKLAKLDERNGLDCEPSSYRVVGMNAEFHCKPVDHAGLARRRQEMIDGSRRKATKRAEHYTSIPVTLGGTIPFINVSESQVITETPGGVTGTFSDPEYYYYQNKEKQTTVFPRQDKYVELMSDSWTGLYNQLGDYVAKSNDGLVAMIGAVDDTAE